MSELAYWLIPFIVVGAFVFWRVSAATRRDRENNEAYLKRLRQNIKDEQLLQATKPAPPAAATFQEQPRHGSERHRKATAYPAPRSTQRRASDSPTPSTTTVYPVDTTPYVAPTSASYSSSEASEPYSGHGGSFGGGGASSSWDSGSSDSSSSYSSSDSSSSSSSDGGSSSSSSD